MRTLGISLGVALISIFFISGAFLAHAQDNASDSVRTQRVQPLPAVRDTVEQVRTNLRDTASDVRARVASTTNAIRTTAQQKRDAMHEELQEKRAQLKERADAARDVAREHFGAAVERHVGNIVERLTHAAEHLVSIAERIGARIDELQAQGLTMEKSEVLLADAQTAIRTAQEKIAAVGTTLERVLASDTPRTLMSEVRSAVKEAIEALKTAKDALKDVIAAMREEGASSNNEESPENN